MQKIVPVVLAGGSGTRLWPMSRSARPKQFLPLLGTTSLFQATLERVSDGTAYYPAIVLTNEDYRFIVVEQAQQLNQRLGAVLLEPVARNTAAAIAAAAAFVVEKHGSDAIMLVLPSDHAITPGEDYRSAITRAAAEAREGRLVTFGIVPTHPETGYGYISADAQTNSNGASNVLRFVEKPARKNAEKMLAEGGFYWNSGMFMLPARSFLDEASALAPKVHDSAVDAVAKAKRDLEFLRLNSQAFSASPDISIDYAIFEKSKIVSVVPAAFAWSDLGSWDAVWKLRSKDPSENVIDGPATVNNVTRSLVISEKAHVVIEGLDDLAVIASEDAIYVSKLSEAQSVGSMVKLLKLKPDTRPLTELHKTAYRPWGGYSSILAGDRFQVKRLFVKPGKKLSLQKHHHRSEHWVVVRGTAEVTIDDRVEMLTENQSIYLPLGCTHRLANPGKILLELIEVQTGSYLGEDDIIRIEDEFGRA